MDPLSDTPRQPTFWQNLSAKIAKNFPYFIAGVIRTLSYGLFKVIGFLKQVIADAIGH